MIRMAGTRALVTIAGLDRARLGLEHLRKGYRVRIATPVLTAIPQWRLAIIVDIPGL